MTLQTSDTTYPVKPAHSSAVGFSFRTPGLDWLVPVLGKHMRIALVEGTKRRILEVSMKRQSGLTIVELMITLAIAAVLMGIAMPAFNGFIEQRTLTTQVNAFLLSVQYSRSEATRQGTNVSMIALDASDDTNEWGPGWCVAVGNPGVCPAPGAATSLRRFDATTPNTLTGEGALNTVDRLTFNSRGLLVGALGGTLELCGVAGSNGRRISLAATGRASSSQVVCP